MSKIIQSVLFWLSIGAAVLMSAVQGVYVTITAAMFVLATVVPMPLAILFFLCKKESGAPATYIILSALIVHWLRQNLAKEKSPQAKSWLIAAVCYPWLTLSARLFARNINAETRSLYWKSFLALMCTSCLASLAAVLSALVTGLLDGSYLRSSWISTVFGSGQALVLPVLGFAPSVIISLIADGIFRYNRRKERNSAAQIASSISG